MIELLNSQEYASLKRITHAGIPEGDAVEPVMLARAGDYEIGIFAPAMDDFQLVIVKDDEVLVDESFDTQAEAIDRLNRFLSN